jgi:uncharacterized membrane protein YcfT
VADLLAWLEGSPLGHAMRNAGVWSYGIVNLIHILGVGSLFGAVLVLDLRLLGAWRSVPLASITRPTVPIAATGFVIAATSGLCLISTNATEYIGNPFLLIKFPAIALGFVNAVVVRRLASWKARESRELTTREQRQLSVFGAVSLASWLTAISAGRLIGYW